VKDTYLVCRLCLLWVLDLPILPLSSIHSPIPPLPLFPFFWLVGGHGLPINMGILSAWWQLIYSCIAPGRQSIGALYVPLLCFLPRCLLCCSFCSPLLPASSTETISFPAGLLTTCLRYAPSSNIHTGKRVRAGLFGQACCFSYPPPSPRSLAPFWPTPLPARVHCRHWVPSYLKRASSVPLPATTMPCIYPSSHGRSALYCTPAASCITLPSFISTTLRHATGAHCHIIRSMRHALYFLALLHLPYLTYFAPAAHYCHPAQTFVLHTGAGSE